MISEDGGEIGPATLRRRRTGKRKERMYVYITLLLTNEMIARRLQAYPQRGFIPGENSHELAGYALSTARHL